MEIKVGDFGLATIVNFEGEKKRTICGTPNYIAPEILDEDDYTEKIDIWSFGCVLYEMIELEKLFHSNSVQTLNDISKFDTFKLKIANMSALYQITIRK